MGYLYEDLLRLASDLSNKEAGDHFTPREVISLMVNVLVSDTPDLHLAGKVLTVYDPTCGTGGMLTEAEHRLLTLNDKAKVYLFGQEVQDKAYAVCKADMLIKGQDASNIACDDTLVNDRFPDRRFDYVIANPPYGVDWSEAKPHVDAEAKRGFAGRFGAGTPSKSDGQLLFLQHMVAKAKTADEGGGRVAVVLNGSPLFSGDAGSGESNIRKWLFESDLVEAIIGLPNQLFYNTGIFTYVWVLSTAKRPERQGLVHLIDARDLFVKMGKSLGDKRNELSPGQIAQITAAYESFASSGRCKILPNKAFGYTQVTVERPLRQRYDVTGETGPAVAEKFAGSKTLAKLDSARLEAIVKAVNADAGWSSLDPVEALAKADEWVSAGGKVTKALREAVLSVVATKDPTGLPVPAKKGYEPDASLRDAENIPLTEDVDAYLAREVEPFAPEAWADRSKDKVGYEVPFTRFFYKYVPPRPLEEIDSDIKASQERILFLLREVAG
jgi:type I restriction enzyme M protein